MKRTTENDAVRGADDRAIAEAATRWFMRRDAGLEPPAERELAAWRRADPRHEEAFRRAEQMWAVFDRAEKLGGAALLEAQLAVRARRRRGRRRLTAALGAVGALALSGWWGLGRTGLEPAAAVAAPIVLEALQTLPDGSIAELRDLAEIAIEFEPAARRVRLVRGEAHFRVQSDPSRPFIVEARGVAVRAVGTAFSVRLEPGEVEVLVTHGVVAVQSATVATSTTEAPLARAEAGMRVLVLTAGPDQLAARLEPIEATELEKRLAWRTARLKFNGTELAAAVRAMNEHNRVQIVLADKAVQRLRVSGAFRSDNPHGFVRIVQETFALEVEQRSETEVVLSQPRGSRK